MFYIGITALLVFLVMQPKYLINWANSIVSSFY